MRKTISWTSLLILVLAADLAFGQAQPTKPAKAKRVFTNDDLSRFGEKYGADATPAQTSSPKGATAAEKADTTASVLKPPASEERSKWVGKLKEAETALQKAKADQAKYSGALEKFEQKHREAQTDFQKNLTHNQIADSLNNLNRATEEVKQAEENKARLLTEAEQKGFKPGDLQEIPAAPPLQKQLEAKRFDRTSLPRGIQIHFRSSPARGGCIEKHIAPQDFKCSSLA